MHKMNYAPGLIRYATENGVRHGWSRRQMLGRVRRPRVLVYGAALAVAGVAFVASLALRPSFGVDVIKDRAALARVLDDGTIENVYRLQIFNSAEREQRYRVQVSGAAGLQVASTGDTAVAPVGIGVLPLRVTLPADAAEALRGRATPIVFQVEAQSAAGGGVETVREKSTFYVPR
jgi:polyferredoxin